ncbi:MAG: CRISPR-associated CARF protein Csa3 [Salinigranum sp.]
MRTYVTPIGFNSTSVTRPVLSHGIDTDDRVVLVRPKEETDDSRATEAIDDVRRLLAEVEPDVALSVERVPHDDFETSVLRCRDLLRQAEGKLIVNLGGGARDVFLPFTTAVLGEVSRVDQTLFFSDIDGRVRELELPRLGVTISDSVRETLAVTAEKGGESTIPELTESTNRSKSTIARHVELLQANDAVEAHREGKIKHVALTLTGRLLGDSA